MKYLEDLRVQIVIILIVLLCSFYFSRQKEINHYDLKRNGSITIGEIIDAYTTGIASTYYIKFTYKVDDKRYTESVNQRWDLLAVRGIELV